MAAGNSLAKALKIVRKARGLSQEAFSDVSSRTYMSTLERDLKSPTWAAASSVDTGLSFLSFLELYGTEIAERRMPARRVVEALDVVEHI